MAEQIVYTLLTKIAKEQNFADYDLKIEPISIDGANYTSILFNATITEGDKVLHMFVKVAAFGEKMRSQAPKFYDTEIFVYTKLSKVYERLQEEHSVPLEHRLVFPKFYGCNPNKFEEIVVLENLVMNGYEPYDRFKTFDWEFAKSAITELAKLHSLAFAYGEYHPEEFSKILEDLKFEWDTTSDYLKVYFKNVVASTIRITRDENKDKMQKFFESYKDTFLNYCKWSYKPVLGHGDYRPSNLMHKTRDDGTVEIKIVDQQRFQGSSPIADLLFFIYTGSDEKFRAQYYDKLVEHYYTELSAALKRLHLNPEDIYSKVEFYSELEKKLPIGLMIAASVLPIVTVDAKAAPKVDEDLDLTSFSLGNISDLYAERLNGIINDYVKFGILK